MFVLKSKYNSDVARLITMLAHRTAQVKNMEHRLRKADHDVETLELQLRAANVKLAQRMGAGTIDRKLLQRLIRLCHPDRHGGSQVANEVTVELLKMR